jgi:hypothetical protein
MTSLYPRIVGDRWRELPERLRQCFEVPSVPTVNAEMRASGHFRVRWGDRALARWLARLGGLPRTGERVEVELTVTSDAEGETWRRRFGSDELVTRQWEERGLLTERAGSLELRFRLSVSNGRLFFQQEGAVLKVGVARISLPRWLSPRVSACAWEQGQMQVSVEVSFPGVGLLCGYEGSLERTEIPQ